MAKIRVRRRPERIRAYITCIDEAGTLKIEEVQNVREPIEINRTYIEVEPMTQGKFLESQPLLAKFGAQHSEAAQIASVWSSNQISAIKKFLSTSIKFTEEEYKRLYPILSGININYAQKLVNSKFTDEDYNVLVGVASKSVKAWGDVRDEADELVEFNSENLHSVLTHNVQFLVVCFNAMNAASRAWNNKSVKEKKDLEN